MKLSNFAKKLGLSYRGAWDMYHRGDIPGAFQLPSGTIIVPDPKKLCQELSQQRAIIYARVSSSENKNNLDKQSERLQNFAASKGYTIIKAISEIGSGINDQRPKLISILKETDYDILLVEHKDRLTRFGFNYINVLLNQLGKTIEVINESENAKEDLIQDFVSIITSFCARLYGQRRNKRRTEKLIKELQNDQIG